MKKGLIILVVVLVNQVCSLAQDKVEGVVVKGTIFEIVNNEKVALAFANVFIEGTDFVTTTDFDGNFEIVATENAHHLKCTFRGYETFVKEIDATNIKSIELDILMKHESTALKNEKVAIKG